MQSRIILLFAGFVFGLCMVPLEAASDKAVGSRLKTFSQEMLQKRWSSIGYPVNQNTELKEFYEWYLAFGVK